MKLLLRKIQFKKLANNFQFSKLLSGSSVIVVRYNEFFEKTDPFGIKLNTLNMKKLREGRSGITFLRMLRRSSRDSYIKFTKNTETQFNLLVNEYTDSFGRFFKTGVNASLNIFNDDNAVNAEKMENFFLTGFQGLIYRRLSNFHLYTARIYRVKNWANQAFSVKGFRNSFFTHFQIRSKPYYNRVVVFGKPV